MVEYLSGERIQGSKTITVDKLKGTSKPSKVTNNTMFVGSTKELQQMLKQRQSEDE